MSRPLSNDALTQLCEFLLKRSDEAFARIDAMRMLLVQKRAFSQKEFDAVFSHKVSRRKQATAQLRAEWTKRAQSPEQRQFVASLAGKKKRIGF